MKLFGNLVGWLAGGEWWPEAWSRWPRRSNGCQYHTTGEGRGYRWLELSTNAPPFFARWTTPLDPEGKRWICFDRTRRTGPYNRLFLDSNGDGRLDDEEVKAIYRETTK